MIQVQLKLKLRPSQERILNRWLWHLTGVYNWAIRKIEADAQGGIFHGVYAVKAMLNGHSQRMGIPAVILQGTAATAHNAWHRCFTRLARRPKLKGRRNRLNSIAIPLGRLICKPHGYSLHGVGKLRHHKQAIPIGHVGQARIVRRASGWYLCLFIQAEPLPVPHIADGQVGIDPGFSSLITTSAGEIVEHPHEWGRAEQRLGQAIRGGRRRLTARLHERIWRRRHDRNHKLSRRLVSENALIAWSKDSSASLARIFGKSVHSAGHQQLRTMLAYKSRAGGRQFIEVSSRNSTRTCSVCRSLSGPTGYVGLSVRQWDCSVCGTHHDRDCNAAVNTLIAGLGISHERRRETAPGIATMQHGEVHAS